MNQNIPLPFFYTRDSGLALPIVALPFCKIKFNFDIWKDLLTQPPSFNDVWILEKIEKYYKVRKVENDDDLMRVEYIPDFYNLNRVVKRIQRRFIEKLYKPDGLFYNKIKKDFELKIQKQLTCTSLENHI